MRTEYTEQTRWGHDPEAIDPDEVPPGAVYIKQMAWVACGRCDLQVHAAITQFIGGGVICPDCGARLTSPRVLGNPDVAAAHVAESEEMLKDFLESDRCFGHP